jgi:hypothetical protein
MSMVISSFDSCYQETKIVNGEKSLTHYVVKRTPFHITVSLRGKFKSSPDESTLDFRLVYADNGELVEDPDTPFEYEAKPSDDEMLTYEVECRISVLTSQSRNRNFSIVASIQCGDLLLETRSDPICCVSKQQQIRKKMAEASGDSAAQRGKKRVRCEDVVAELDEIKASQRRILKQLGRLLPPASAGSARPPAAGTRLSAKHHPQHHEETQAEEEVDESHSHDEEPPLRDSLAILARSLARIATTSTEAESMPEGEPEEEPRVVAVGRGGSGVFRPTKLRKVMLSLSPVERTLLTAFSRELSSTLPGTLSQTDLPTRPPRAAPTAPERRESVPEEGLPEQVYTAIQFDDEPSFVPMMGDLYADAQAVNF